MIVQECDSADGAMRGGLRLLLEKGCERPSRNGRVLVMAEPVATVYRWPERRVVMSPVRDANPFFHLFEALWMLAGRNDVALPARYAQRMSEYSDDGVTLAGAYGHRWRVHFGGDQLEPVVQALRANHDDRRQVVQMWDAGRDLLEGQAARKDLPCNLAATVQIGPAGDLDMVVFQRSGDALWGVHGANVVQFTVLMEYLAQRVGVDMGRLTHVTANYHLYEPYWGLARSIVGDSGGCDEEGRCVLLGAWAAGWDAACEDFCAGGEGGGLRFFREVALPMRQAHGLHKAGDDESALRVMRTKMPACDWRSAGEAWIKRRMKNRGQ